MRTLFYRIGMVALLTVLLLSMNLMKELSTTSRVLGGPEDQEERRGGVRADPDLVGLWHFDEGSGTVAHDDSGNGNDGQLNLGTEGSTTPEEAWTEGLSGSALYFDGDDDILDCGNDASLDITDEITVMVWVKCDLDSPSRPAIVAKYTSADKGYLLRWDRNKGFFFAVEASPVYSRESDLNLGTNEWYHLAATFKDDIRLYVNGIPADGEPHGDPPGRIGSSAESLTIGKRTDADVGFNGTLDEVKLYKRAMSPAEVQEEYEKVVLRGGWGFDGGGDTAASDASGFDNDGVLTDGDGNNGDGDTPPTRNPGVVGNGLVLDGTDDYVKVPKDPSLDFERDDDLTVTAWLKTTSDDGVIVSNKDGNSYFDLRVKDKCLLGTVTVGGRDTRASVSLKTTTLQGRLNDNMWHYVVMTVDRDSDTGFKLFIDGWEKKVGDPTGLNTISSSSPLNIGRDPLGEDGYFDGMLDEVKIWNSAFGERIIKHTFDLVASSAQVPPVLVKEVPSKSFEEDSVGRDLYNVSDYFKDLWDWPTEMNYSVEEVYAEHVEAELTGYLISFSVTEVNWTGKASFKIGAENTKGLTAESNVFQLTVTNVNDLPVWKTRPAKIVMEEDEVFTSAGSLFDHVYDAEGDPLEFELDYPAEELNITITDTGHINISFKEEHYHGSMNLSVTVKELNSSVSGPTVEIPLTVLPKNDLPVVTLLGPASDAVVTDVNVTLRWAVKDVDDRLRNITFDIYFGEQGDLRLVESGYEEMEINMTGLDDITVYGWKVIPYDAVDEGVCEGGVRNFTVDTQADLPKIRLKTPTNGTTLMATEVNFSWEIAVNPGADQLRYKIYHGDAKDNLSLADTTVRTWFEIEDLMPDTRYFWKVIPYVGGLEGVCLSGIWSYSIGDIPFYKLEVSRSGTKLDVSVGKSVQFNFTLVNRGNRLLDIKIITKGNISDYLGSFDEMFELGVGEEHTVELTLEIDDEVIWDTYSMDIEILYRGEKKTLTYTVEVKERSGDGTGGEDKGGGLGDWALIIGLSVVGLAVLILILSILIIKINKKKQEKTAAEKAKREEEKRRKEEEEKAKWQARQEALSKDHSRWRRDDVDYDKYEDVSTEGWEKQYMGEINKEMAEIGGTHEAKPDSKAFTFSDEKPRFGDSLDIEGKND